MKPIQLQFSVTLDEHEATKVVDLIRSAVVQPVGFDPTREARIKASQHAFFAGQKPPEDKGLLVDTNEVAKLLKVSARTVWKVQNEGEKPKPIRIGRAVRWNYEEIKNAGCPKSSRQKRLQHD